MNRMQQEAKISIVMPTYNRAALIKETLDSIIRQTYTNWELLIIDDGSDDNTQEIITKINDDRIQFFKLERTGIGSKMKNFGIERSSGEFIAFIDSDDLWAPTKLEKQVNMLKSYPDAGFCLTGGFNFRNDLEPVDHFYKRKEGLRYDNLFLDCFTSGVAAFTQALMLRKKCISTSGKFKQEKIFSDVEFIYNLALHFKGIILYEPLVYRRLHDTNDSESNWIKRHYEGLKMIGSYKKELPQKIFRDALFRSKINFGEKCLRYKKRGTAIISFLNAWKQKPFSIVPLKKIVKTILFSLKGK